MKEIHQMKLADEIGAQDPEMAMFTIDAFLPAPRSPPNPRYYPSVFQGGTTLKRVGF